MKARPAEMHGDILAAYKDVLLCDNLLFLLREANVREMDYGTRLLYVNMGYSCLEGYLSMTWLSYRGLQSSDALESSGLLLPFAHNHHTDIHPPNNIITHYRYRKVTDAAQSATTELGALVKTESVRHLQTIHDVCEVAATYQQNEGQFLDRMEELRPLFDTTLLGFLNYAMQEEEMRIAAAGGDAQRLPSPWIQVRCTIGSNLVAIIGWQIYSNIVCPPISLPLPLPLSPASNHKCINV